MSISGKFLTVKLGGAVVRGPQAWTVSETCHVLDGQTAKHGGFSADECGTPSAAITIELVQDTKDGPYSGIRRGTRLLDLALFRSEADALPAFLFPFANVMKSENAGQVKSRWTVRVEASNFGPYEARIELTKLGSE